MQTSPDRAQILERLCGLISGRVNVDPTLLHPEANLADIGIDSFLLIELVFQAEEAFNITIPFEGLGVKTVGDVLDVIQQRLSNPNS